MTNALYASFQMVHVLILGSAKYQFAIITIIATSRFLQHPLFAAKMFFMDIMIFCRIMQCVIYHQTGIAIDKLLTVLQIIKSILIE